MGKKSLFKTGYLEYLDERGLTRKAKREKEAHAAISELTKTIKEALNNLGHIFTLNCTTVISSSHFGNLESIIEDMYKMWDQSGYPFREEILVRTSKFNVSSDFSLPLTHIPVRSAKETALKLTKLIPEMGNPDQYLLHPRLKISNLRRFMYAARFSSDGSTLKADIGYKGMKHIRDIEKAQYQFQGEVGSKIEINATKGELRELQDNLQRILLVGKIVTPLIEELIVPQKLQHKDIISEVRIIPHASKLYMLFSDYEVF